jgi:hypothetical protein
VFNPKVSGIIAGIAFILSFLIGLFTGSQFFSVLLRALILAAIFFALSSLAYWLINQFLPELLSNNSDAPGEIDVPGSKVDISIESSDDDSESEPVKNSSFVSENPIYEDASNSGQQYSMQGLDQKTQDDYNKTREGGLSPAQTTAEMAAVPGKDTSESVDVLPDLESMSGYFAQPEESESDGDVVEMEEDVSSSLPSMSEPSRTKKNSDPGDFNVQEMASAIQTILRRDEKG